MSSYTGTDGADTIAGTDDADRISGLGGADILIGLGGKDIINGGDGADQLYGMVDTIDDGKVDILNGGAGDDYIVGGVGDKVDGGSGNDIAVFEFGHDAAPLTVDYTNLHPGQAYTFADGASMTGVEMASITFGSGDDHITLSNFMSITADGGEGDDVIQGGVLDDNIFGDLGSDTLSGGKGNDQIDAGGYDFAPDTLSGGPGDDMLYGMNGDTLDGGPGHDGFSVSMFSAQGVHLDLRNFSATGTIQVDSSTLLTGMEYGTLRLGDGDDTVNLGDAHVSVLGRFGNDVIKGGDGDDAIGGSEGDDTLIGGKGVDTVNYDDIYGHFTTDGVTVSLAIRGAQDTGQYGGVDTLSGFENLIGTETGNDTLTGSKDANQIIGLGGDDTIDGGAGDDQLYGGLRFDPHQQAESDNDHLIGGAGNDLLNGGAGGDVLEGGAGADTFVYASYTDTYHDAPDRIVDLQDKDVIDLSGVDANYYTAGDDAFTLVSGPSTQAATMWWAYDSGAHQSTLWLNDTGGTPTVLIHADGDHRGFDHFVL